MQSDSSLSIALSDGCSNAHYLNIIVRPRVPYILVYFLVASRTHTRSDRGGVFPKPCVATVTPTLSAYSYRLAVLCLLIE
jgi:hypothetical protein